MEICLEIIIMFLKKQTPPNTKQFWPEKTLEIIKVFLVLRFSRSLFYIPFNFPWGNEYYLQYFATILKVFSPVGTILATSLSTFSIERCSFFFRWSLKEEKMGSAAPANSEPNVAFRSVALCDTGDSQLKRKRSWNLIEGISVSEISCNIHVTISRGKVLESPRAVTPILVYCKFSWAAQLRQGIV